ncbi:MAG TPA: NAD(P) transhydrogenase subunit alpha [Phycisphaeraceae bacterium]
MKIAVPRQSRDGETRVALVPQVIKRLVGAGLEVLVEAGAGHGSSISDEACRQAGARVVGGAGSVAADLWTQADVVLVVQPPQLDQAGLLKPGAVLAGLLSPLTNPQLVRVLQERGVTAFAMEFLPRISRAQSMDVLSSQANLAGYKAVILAADHCPKIFPMMMTAAGTLAPARVFVLGAGVAGLQAIATAVRLGAVVEAYDVRPATREQVQSLGARFVELPLTTQQTQTAGGYAHELSEEQKRQQAQLMAKHVIGADAVITTAAVFGKAPPMLIPADVAAQMSPGSVIVDLAADPHAERGNCQLTRPGQVYTFDGAAGGVTIIGTLNLPRLVPVHASFAFANNMQAFLKEIVAEGQVRLNLEDEIQNGACIVHEGQVRNELVQRTLT